jgi:hypothetical protein
MHTHTHTHTHTLKILTFVSRYINVITMNITNIT